MIMISGNAVLPYAHMITGTITTQVCVADEKWQMVMAVMLMFVPLLCCCAHCAPYVKKYRPDNANEVKLLAKSPLRNSSTASTVNMSKCEADSDDLTDVISALGMFRFTERKQKGRTFEQVYKNDALYCKWILDHEGSSDLSFAYKLFAQYIHLIQIAGRRNKHDKHANMLD